MKCACNYCVYNNNFQCGLDRTEIDEVGKCADYITVYLTPEILEEYKIKRLKKITDRETKDMMDNEF